MTDLIKKENLSFVYYLLKNNSKKIKGINNTIKHSGSFLNRVTFDIEGENNEVLIEKGTRLSNVKFVVKGSNQKIFIRKNCILKNTILWAEDMHCSLSIGENTTIEGAHIAVTEPNSEIKLGKDCMLSSGIDIRNGDSHSILDLETGRRINYAKNIVIGDHVWIGNNVQILKGVTIGSNSIVGVRSLVTKDVKENSIVAGIPARTVKENVNWDRKRIYEQ